MKPLAILCFLIGAFFLVCLLVLAGRYVVLGQYDSETVGRGGIAFFAGWIFTAIGSFVLEVKK